MGSVEIVFRCDCGKEERHIIGRGTGDRVDDYLYAWKWISLDHYHLEAMCPECFRTKYPNQTLPKLMIKGFSK